MTHTSDISGPQDVANKRNRHIAISSAAAISQRILQVAGTLLLIPVLLRVLGPANFGVWGAAASVAWLAGFADLGTGAALVTLVARSVAVRDICNAQRQIGGALRLACGIAVLGLGAVVVVIIAAPRGSTGPYVIAIAGILLNIPASSASHVWIALQKGYVASFWEAVQTLLVLAAVFTAAPRTSDVRVFVAIVYVCLIISNLGALVHLFFRHPELKPDLALGGWAGGMRLMANEAITYFLLALEGTLFFALDNVMALALLGPEASARMTIALRICVSALGLLGVASQPLWPAFAEAAQRNDRHWIRVALFRGSALLLGVAATGSLLLVIYGGRFLEWWLHQRLGIDNTLLWSIAAWLLAHALVRVPALLLNGVAIIRYQVVIASVALVLALALKPLLAGRLGDAGILWGTTISALLIVFPGVLWRVFQWHRCPTGGSAHITLMTAGASRLRPRVAKNYPGGSD